MNSSFQCDIDKPKQQQQQPEKPSKPIGNGISINIISESNSNWLRHAREDESDICRVKPLQTNWIYHSGALGFASAIFSCTFKLPFHPRLCTRSNWVWFMKKKKKKWRAISNYACLLLSRRDGYCVVPLHKRIPATDTQTLQPTMHRKHWHINLNPFHRTPQLPKRCSIISRHFLDAITIMSIINLKHDEWQRRWTGRNRVSTQ